MFNKLKIIAAAVLIGFSAMPFTAAQDFEKGMAATSNGDFATALKEWKPLAEQGDAYAQDALGLMYFQGQGVPQDNIATMKWFK
ncbi:MAG: hypothetical protein N2B02_00655 [Amylibacter sp.]